MNWIGASLRRPFTVVVIVLGLALAGLSALFRLPKDIFPTLGVPVLYVAQPYGGMDPAQMEGYLTYYYEYHFLYITGIEHVESKSIQGAALLRLQFHPGTDMAQALAETIGYVNRARAFMPAGTVPPFVMRFDGGSVPVGNLVFRSDSHSVAELQDAALNRVRPLFATLPGVSAPPPFGGSAREIVVRLNPDRLRALRVAPDREYADQVYAALLKVPSLRDLQFQQALDVPTVDVNVDRERAGQMGLTIGDVSRSLVPAVASTRFTVPVYWADPGSGVAYQIQVEIPQVRMNSMEEIRNLPISGDAKEGQLLRNVATVRPGEALGEYDR